jgi:tetratricopeptide (TPR) repeat protein
VKAVVLAAGLALWLGAGAARAGDAGPGGVPVAARQRFLASRDPEALLAARPPVTADPVWDLVLMAAGRAPASQPADAQGRAALPAVVLALRRLDLDGAEQAVQRADRGDRSGLPAAWVHALVLLRRGDDAGAVGRLLAPPLFAWDRDAFGLALLGVALQQDDRRMLAAGARAALLRAAARGRQEALVATAEAAAAVDRAEAPRALVLALRALRRSGRAEQARGLLAFAARVGVDVKRPAVALEAALLAWEAGDVQGMTERLAGPATPGAQGVYLALRHAGRRPRLPAPERPWRHARGATAAAAVAAHLASRLGVPTAPAEIEAWGRQQGRDLGLAGALRAALEARGLRVVEAAGDPAAADAALDAGLPFVWLRLARDDGGYREAPALVRGEDRRAGLWILDEPDLARVDLALRAQARKSRLLLAAPPDRAGALAAVVASPAARTGARIGRALERLDAGDGEAAATLLAAPAPGASGTVQSLYRGYVLWRRAVAARDDGLLAQAQKALDVSRRTPPLTPFEAYARGEALVARGDLPGALAAFDQTARLEGVGVGLQLARFAAHMAAGAPRKALDAVEQAVRLDPLDVRALFHRGTTRAALEDRWAGRADLQRALERRPSSVAVAVALAQMEVHDGHAGTALDVLREVVRRNPGLRSDATLSAARRAAELELIAHAETVEALRPVLRSPEVETRRRLAFALAERSGEGDAAESLLRTLLRDPDAGVRATTLRVYQRGWLRRRIEQDAVLGRHIAQLLAEDASADVRKVAAALLARVRGPRALHALAAALAGGSADADAGVRAAAARALALHPDPDAETALVGGLEDADAGVRRDAIDSLFQLEATRLDFDPDATAAARAAAVAAWRRRLQAAHPR